MDLAESHDAQKYGYIFLYMFIHTRNYIEENPGYINKGWRPLCQNINDAENKSLPTASVTYLAPTYLTLFEGRGKPIWFGGDTHKRTKYIRVSKQR